MQTMGRLQDKVAFITGAARGQGRAHALAMAREGADIVAIDLCEQIEMVPYPLATPEDLAETARLVEEQNRRCLTIRADARDSAAMRAAVAEAVAAFGGIDIGVINHGIVHITSWDTITDDEFDLMIETNLTSVWRAARAVAPHLVARGGGSLLLTASSAGLRPFNGLLSYTASKHGVVGLAKALAVELAPHSVRVNALCPGNVATPMFFTQHLFDAYNGAPGGTIDDAVFPAEAAHLLPVPWYEPAEIAYAAVYLASDEARYVTGTAFSVDAGMVNQPAGIPPIAASRIAELEHLLGEKA